MRFPKNMLVPGIYEKPNIYLCETNKEKICKLNTTDTKASLKFNSLSELSFEVGRFYNDDVTGETLVHPFYDKIEALRLILVEDFGYFELQGPELIGDGIKESKMCKAYSLEYTLAQKYLDDFIINKGTTKSMEVLNASNPDVIVPITLYNPSNTKLSLLHLILEKCYGCWTIGHVDAQLRTMSRQFEIDRTSIYDFLMNEICDKFNCYIVFDTINSTINVYAESPTAKFRGDGKTTVFKLSTPFSSVVTVSIDGYKTTRWEYTIVDDSYAVILETPPEEGAYVEVVGIDGTWETDVFVSFENLAQEVNVSYSADDIKTVLTVTYGDDENIREVNLGLPYITDISYYYTVDWMGQELYDAYGLYLDNVDKHRSSYTKNVQEIVKINDQISYCEHRLSLEYSLAEVSELTVGTYYVQQEDANGNKYYSEVSLPADYKVDTQYYSNLDTNVNEDKVNKLYSALAEYSRCVLTHDEDLLDDAIKTLNELKGFDFLTNPIFSQWLAQIQSATNKNEIESAVNAILNQLWIELGRTPLNELYLKPYNQKKDIQFENGWSNEKHANYGQYFVTMCFIDSISIAITNLDKEIEQLEKNKEPYTKANATISEGLNMENNFTPEQLKRLSAFLREDELHLDDFVETSLDDLSSSLTLKQDAMESGRIELQKLCQPQLQFSMTMANIYALSEFEPIVWQFQLGNIIKIGIRKDYIKQSRLLQVDVNFDDFSDFSCTFGELTNIRTQSDIHADLLSNAISAGKSVATYSSYWTRGADMATSTDLKIQKGLLDATTQIKAMDGNQGVVIDKYGIKLQKNIGNGEVDPHQTWLVNNMILMSDDGFKTSRSALGEITVDGKTRYGLLAEAVLAGYIEGSKIVGGTLSSDNYESGKSGTHFDLTNGDFEIGGGKIVYDADKNNLTLKDTTIEWDSTNTPSASEIDGLEEDIKSTIITKEYIETLSIKAGSVDAENISGTTITGKTLNGGSININDRFMVDDQGNVTIPSGTIKIGELDGYDSLAKVDDIPTDDEIVTIAKGGITASYISTLNLIVGNEIQMGDNATISWGQVNDKPNVATEEYVTQQGYQTADSIKSTVITKEYIETLNIKAGSVDAENISGTTITGKTINGGNLLIGNKENTYAEITTDGVLNCNGANITGTITATAGNIGGCTIDEENGLQVGAAHIIGPLTIGQLPTDIATTDNIPTNVSDLNNDSGYQTETGVVSIIDGTVNADYVNALGIKANSIEIGNLFFAGKDSSDKNKVTIGGWNVDSNSLYSTYADSASRVFMCTGTLSNYTIGGYTDKWYFGAGTSNGNGFGVTTSGVLCASGAKISGEITATGGDIGGCQISEGKLYIKEANADGLKAENVVLTGTFTSYGSEEDGNVWYSQIDTGSLSYHFLGDKVSSINVIANGIGENSARGISINCYDDNREHSSIDFVCNYKVDLGGKKLEVRDIAYSINFGWDKTYKERHLFNGDARFHNNVVVEGNLIVNDKSAYWHDNGDGTYTLMAKD